MIIITCNSCFPFCISYSLFLVSLHFPCFSLNSSLCTVCMLVQSFHLCSKCKKWQKYLRRNGWMRETHRRTHTCTHQQCKWKWQEKMLLMLKNKCTLFLQSFKARRNGGDMKKHSIFSFHFVHLSRLCCCNWGLMPS